MIIPVIMTGGKGERLWPLSRAPLTKPFIQLEAGQETLLQRAIRRAGLVEGAQSPIFVCGSGHEQLIREQAHAVGAQKFTLLVEPVGRDTAAAIAAAALLCAARGQADEVMLVLAADHLIADEQGFADAVASGLATARAGQIVTFAIPATYPTTGYGYLDLQPMAGSQLARVARFVEKPDAALAAELLACGNFAWNSGMFMFQPRVIIDELKRLLPDLLHKVQQSLPTATGSDAIHLSEEAFGAIKPVSIDKGVMEHVSGIVAVKAAIGWSDVGDWDAVWQTSSQRLGDVVVSGPALAYDSKSSLLRSEGPLLLGIGLENMVAVATSDAVLVAPRSRTQDLKLALAALQASPPPAIGSAQVLTKGSGFTVSRHEISPGQKLSLNARKATSYSIVVLSGQGNVATVDATSPLYRGATISMATSVNVVATGDEPLVLLVTRLQV